MGQSKTDLAVTATVMSSGLSRLSSLLATSLWKVADDESMLAFASSRASSMFPLRKFILSRPENLSPPSSERSKKRRDPTSNVLEEGS